MGRPRLRVGGDTIDTSKIVPGRAKGTLSMQWRIRLSDEKIEKHITEMRTTKEWELRDKARETAAQLLKTPEHKKYEENDPIVDYIREQAIPSIENATHLRPNSKLRYVHVLELMIPRLRGYDIGAVTAAVLKQILIAVAKANGTATAKQAKKVMNTYVMSELDMDGVLVTRGNPFNSMKSLRWLPDHVAREKPAGGQALTPDERRRVLDYLLALDPAEGATKRGRYGLEGNIARRALAIDVTLLQAVCGLRISEVRQLTAEDVDLDADPITVTITNEKSKTHTGRTVPVVNEAVAERIRARVEATGSPQEPVFHAPSVPGSVWDSSNAQKAIKRLYTDLSEALDIPLLNKVSSHVWRSTLNTEWMNDGVPPEIRSAFLGHTEKVNRTSYTDLTDISPLVEKLRRDGV